MVPKVLKAISNSWKISKVQMIAAESLSETIKNESLSENGNPYYQWKIIMTCYLSYLNQLIGLRWPFLSLMQITYAPKSIYVNNFEKTVWKCGAPISVVYFQSWATIFKTSNFSDLYFGRFPITPHLAENQWSTILCFSLYL